MSGIWFLVESPRWLMEKDRHEEARAVLFRLHDDGTAETKQLIELEYQEIHDVIMADRIAGQTSWKKILTKPSWRKRLLLGIGVQAFGMLEVYLLRKYYRIVQLTLQRPSVWYQCHQLLRSSYLRNPRYSAAYLSDDHRHIRVCCPPRFAHDTALTSRRALSIVYCSIGLYLADKVGRVKPLIVSAIGLAGSLLVNAALSQHLDPKNGNMLRAMVAMNFTFSLFYTPLGIISWVYPAEIFPVEVRALGNAITTFTNWFFNLIFAQFSPQALASIGFRYFYVFFVFNVIAAVVYWVFYPETKGKTLEQMDELFGDQLVPHALQDPKAAELAMEEIRSGSIQTPSGKAGEVVHVESSR